MSDFGLRLENHYARLPDDFYTSMPAEKIGERPRLIHANPDAAELLDLDPAVFNDPHFVEVVSGHRPLEGFSPLAMVYSGHQFGVWAGQLGDGRALLIGQVRNRKNELWDIQLKGAGKTPYSRFGAGRIGYPDVARTGHRGNRRDGEARNTRTWRGADPAGPKPCPLRPFRAFL